MTRFFVLHPVVGSPYETAFEEAVPVRLGDAPQCAKCGLFVGSKPWLPPYRAIVKGYGQQLGDIAFGVGSSLLVSEPFRRAWEAAELQGLRFAALEELSIRPAKLAKTSVSFFQVLIEHRDTLIDERRSIIERSESASCEQCKAGGVLKNIRGFSIAESTWSGEDIFYAWGLPGTIVVTDRVAQLAERNGLRNVHVTAVEDYVWDPLHRQAVPS